MRVFLTGATGFIGTELIRVLIKAGHTVLGLTRSDKGAAALTASGAEVHRGDLEDLDSLRRGAAASDGVIHCGFVHDFSRFAEVCEIDRCAIEAMGDALAGSDRPLVVTSGTGMGMAVPGQPAIENHYNPNHPNPRAASEIAAEAVAGRGVRVTVVRLPQVHNTEKQGLVTPAIAIAREKGLAA
jgi:nucleoside-diphosphate-sugar epimerase